MAMLFVRNENGYFSILLIASKNAIRRTEEKISLLLRLRPKSVVTLLLKKAAAIGVPSAATRKMMFMAHNFYCGKQTIELKGIVRIFG